MFLDIGIGILAALWLQEPVWIGAVFALLPDADFLVNLYRHRDGSKIYRHRDLLHLPIVFALISIAIAFFDPKLATLFFVCTMAHFIHDSIGLGWGVQWLWPFSKDHFSFLYLYQPTGKPALPKKYIYRFPHEDISALDAKYGDQNWIHNLYIKMHPFAITETAVFVVAVALLMFA